MKKNFSDTEVEISNRHFQNRQRRQGVVPQSVNEKLKRAVLAPSALEDVEYPDFDNVSALHRILKI